MDSSYFLESLAGNFMDVVQYNEDNREFEVRERGTTSGTNDQCVRSFVTM